MSRLTQWGLLTYKMHMLCADAEAAGFAVRRNGINSLFLGKKRAVEVMVYTRGGGGFLNATVCARTGDLTIRKQFRTLKSVRRILRLDGGAAVPAPKRGRPRDDGEFNERYAAHFGAL